MKIRSIYNIEKLVVIAVAVTLMAALFSACGENAENDDAEETGASWERAFPDFEGTTLDGSEIDSSVFSENAVTVVNFWFSDCPACISEIEDMNELNEELKGKGGEVLGVNTDTFDGNEDAIKEASSIMQTQKATYRNLWVTKDSELAKYTEDFVGYPTTCVVDRNGQIVGEPILGGIDNAALKEELQRQIKAALESDTQKQE